MRNTASAARKDTILYLFLSLLDQEIDIGFVTKWHAMEADRSLTRRISIVVRHAFILLMGSGASGGKGKWMEFGDMKNLKFWLYLSDIPGQLLKQI